MKKFKRSLMGLAIVAGVVFFFILSKTELIETSTNQSSEAALVQDQLVELSDWTTLKYEYSNVIVSRTDKSLSLLGLTELEYAEAIKLIEYTGYLKAGTDLAQLEVMLDEESETVTVRVPKSRVLDHVVETENTRVEDIKGNIFSDYPSQLVFDEINAHKKELEAEKISQGFLEEADERVAELLTSFLKSNGFSEVEIEFY